MDDFPAYRRTAVRYWERRRIVYNLAIVPSLLFGFAFKDTLNWTADDHDTHYGFVFTMFAITCFKANICYSFCYALEFLIGSDDRASRWQHSLRRSSFVGGVMFAMLLALFAGFGIANLEWDYALEQLEYEM